ncbi:hypothetical protein VTK56DRAFT_285 [Thermocarpiscus australiensis]
MPLEKPFVLSTEHLVPSAGRVSILERIRLWKLIAAGLSFSSAARLSIYIGRVLRIWPRKTTWIFRIIRHCEGRRVLSLSYGEVERSASFVNRASI